MEAVLIKPQVVVDKLELDPTFEAGSTHTARATLTNPTTKDFTYTGELYLDVTKVATSGAGEVIIPAGQSMEVSFTMVMPTIEGDYQPYLDAWVGGELIAHYAATELVSIAVIPSIIVGPIIWV
ncbi:hypothetical protein ES708_00233 [subsurface metagenome]